MDSTNKGILSKPTRVQNPSDFLYTLSFFVNLLIYFLHFLVHFLLFTITTTPNLYP